MKTLEQHNEEFIANHKKATTFPRKNGIACPKCNKELSDVSNWVLLSWPTQKEVICESCGHKGYAFC
jgi:uncharacterized protein with PIN domain